MILDDRFVALFRIGPILCYERKTCESHFQKDAEIVTRQIAFKAPAFLIIRICDQHGRCPDGLEAVKVPRIFLDVHT